MDKKQNEKRRKDKVRAEEEVKGESKEKEREKERNLVAWFLVVVEFFFSLFFSLSFLFLPFLLIQYRPI